MSTTLFFLVPLGTLAVAWSLCFVGCVLHTQGQGEPTPYSDGIVEDPNLVAYWALSDLLGTLNTQGATSEAGDLSGNGHNGTYTIPPAYPTTVAQSKPIASPSLARGTAIVPGDTGSTKNVFPASVDFEGGYLSIPWSTQNSPPLPEFTLEAWIAPSWTGTGFLWVVFGAATNNNTGFALYVNDKNNWQLTIGNGTTLQPFDTMLPVDLTSLTYVAVTCDQNGVFNLFVNPASDTSAPPTPNWTSPGSTAYVAVDPTQPVTFFIGAGDNIDAQTLRTQPMGPGAPLYPFQGRIESVALYKAVLDATTLQSHFISGAG